MKKLITLPVVLGLLISGCAVQKHCFINPPLDREYTVTAGGVLVEKVECHGRATVDDCRTALRLTYFGKTEGKIRIQGSVGMVAYSENPKFIEFQDAKIEVIEATDSWIIFKLNSISTQGCNKVNGQDSKLKEK